MQDNDCGCDNDDEVGGVTPLPQNTSLPDPPCEPDGAATGIIPVGVTPILPRGIDCDDWTAPIRPTPQPIVTDGPIDTSRPQPPVLLYYSGGWAFTGYKDNCPSGQTGKAFVYSLKEGAFSSPISAAEANRLAVEWLDTNGPGLANQYGECVPISTNPFSSLSWSSVVGCAAGLLSLTFGDLLGQLVTGCTSGDHTVTLLGLDFGNISGCPSDTTELYSLTFGTLDCQ